MCDIRVVNAVVLFASFVVCVSWGRLHHSRQLLMPMWLLHDVVDIVCYGVVLLHPSLLTSTKTASTIASTRARGSQIVIIIFHTRLIRFVSEATHVVRIETVELVSEVAQYAHHAINAIRHVPHAGAYIIDGLSVRTL